MAASLGGKNVATTHATSRCRVVADPRGRPSDTNPRLSLASASDVRPITANKGPNVSSAWSPSGLGETSSHPDQRLGALATGAPNADLACVAGPPTGVVLYAREPAFRDRSSLGVDERLKLVLRYQRCAAQRQRGMDRQPRCRHYRRVASP